MKLNEFNNELLRLTDRAEDVRACVGRIADTWKYNIADRSFGPAHQDEETGQFTTDLDLAVFLSGLADRRAVIALPTYKGRRAATRTEGEMITSKENRHGRLMRLTSNKDCFSFNAMVEDANVITTADVGKPRNFMLQDLDGTWHDGWKMVEFLAHTDAEKKLFENTEKVSFNHFVHPNRWTSFYSRPYLLAKIAIDRLADQDGFLKAEAKRLRTLFAVPSREWPKSEKTGAEKSETFWAFNSFVDGVEFKGEYTAYPDTQDALEEIGLLRHRIDELITRLRFHTRATEFAFWKHAVLTNIPEDAVLDYLKGEEIRKPLGRTAPGITEARVPRQPAWCKDAWTSRKVKRTYFAQLPRPEGLTLRWRVWRKSERVAA